MTNGDVVLKWVFDLYGISSSNTYREEKSNCRQPIAERKKDNVSQCEKICLSRMMRVEIVTGESGGDSKDGGRGGYRGM